MAKIFTINKSNKSIKSIRELCLEEHKDLERLDLANNFIEHLDEDSFVQNENLIELKLHGNQLKIIKEKIKSQ